jgi:integrase
MAKHSGANGRIKREYLQYLKEARGRGEASIDAVAKALSRFDETSGGRDYAKLHRAQAMAFKEKLAKQCAERSGEALSKATVDGTLRALREFFFWLAHQQGYKSKIQYSDADYFNLSDRDVTLARTKRERPVPTLEQMHHVLSAMPAVTPIERRNRALIAFAVLTGARDGALASLKLKHVDLEQRIVYQDGREVRTKFGKSIPTTFFPVGENALAIVTDWINWLRSDQLWGDDDPLFPSTEMALGQHGGFIAAGLSRRGWNSAGPIREIFRKAFAGAGLPYFNPHSLRNMLARLGQRLCPTVEEYKAWSQNLGHADMLTTLTSYGEVPAHRQAELIRRLGAGKEEVATPTIADVMAKLEAIASAAGR